MRRLQIDVLVHHGSFSPDKICLTKTQGEGGMFFGGRMRLNTLADCLSALNCAVSFAAGMTVQLLSLKPKSRERADAAWRAVTTDFSVLQDAAPTPNCAHPIVSGSAEEDAGDDDAEQIIDLNRQP